MYGSMEIRGANIISDSKKIQRVLTEKLRENEAFASYKVCVRSEHAKAVEYGTNPANPNHAGYGDYVKTTLEKIREWVEEKYGDTYSEKQCRDIAYVTYRKIMEHGLPERPFYRPAVSTLKSRIAYLRDMYADGANIGTYRMAEELVKLMRENIENNQSIYHWDLYNHIDIERDMDLTLDDVTEGVK